MIKSQSKSNRSKNYRYNNTRNFYFSKIFSSQTFSPNLPRVINLDYALICIRKNQREKLRTTTTCGFLA